MKDLMLSQYAAHYAYEGSEEHKNIYLTKLQSELGFTAEQADALLEFECSVLKRYEKKLLLRDDYTELWLFDLGQPYFREYPKEQEDIRKECALCLSEVCKLIDEAEWHFWNSHELNLSDEVWGEIFSWHLKGKGGEFAIGYFQKVMQMTGIPRNKIAAYSSHEGKHLSENKWNKSNDSGRNNTSVDRAGRPVVLPAGTVIWANAKSDRYVTVADRKGGDEKYQYIAICLFFKRL